MGGGGDGIGLGGGGGGLVSAAQHWPSLHPMRPSHGGCTIPTRQQPTSPLPQKEVWHVPVRPSMWHWTSVCERVGCESFIIAWLCAVGYVSFIIMRGFVRDG